MTSAGQGLEAPATEGDAYLSVIDAFSAVAEGLNSDMTLDALLHLICDKICTLLGVGRASLYLKDEKTGEYRGRVARYETDVDEYIKRYVAGVPADQFTREILVTKKPLLVANAQSDPRPVRAQMRRWNIHSMLGIPMIESGDVSGLIFLDNGDEPYPYTDDQQHLAQVFANLAATAVSQASRKGSLRASVAKLEQQNDLLRRLTVIQDRLTSLAVDGASIADIADGVAELVGNPCVIHDAGFRRLAEAGAAGGPLRSALDDPVRANELLSDATTGLGDKRASIIGAELAAGVRRRCLVAPVIVHGERWGYLVIEERRGKFGSLDMAVAQRAATVVAIELVAARRGVEAEFDVRRALVSELVRGNMDPSALQRRAERLGVNLREQHMLAVASSRTPDVGVPAAREIADALGDAHAHSPVLASEIDDGVVLMVEAVPTRHHETLEEYKSAFAGALSQLALDGDLIVGLSSKCSEVGDYVRAHFEARQIVGLLREHGCRQPGNVTVVASEELGAARLLLASHGPRQLDRFIRDALGQMLDDVDPKAATLMRTLECYFRNGRSTKRTAVELDVHENTIRYRLGRVQELAGVDFLTDGGEQLRVHLALLALDVGRQLGASVPGR